MEIIGKRAARAPAAEVLAIWQEYRAAEIASCATG